MDQIIKKGDKIVCIGDSITDTGRRAEFSPYGNGYVKLFHDLLMAEFPEKKFSILNKGIGGNTLLDLQQRWEDDVIYHQPDCLTILIGINDLHRVIRTSQSWEEQTSEQFAKRYLEILDRTRKKSACRIILMEPFYITTDTTHHWRGMVLQKLEAYRAGVQKASETFQIPLIRLHDIFQQHLTFRDTEHFCGEPVHPNQLGHTIIAHALFKEFCK
ncbi:MAG: SGNH/GDSL hydrolase family protein [Candidatus Ratteibacteria bacterium]|jgi:lysophospholipase L1-like esterase